MNMLSTQSSHDPQAFTTLPDRQPVLRVIPMPSDLNAHGDVFGGWVMSQVDLAGAIVAQQRAKGRVATVAVNSFQFKHPIAIGDVISFYGEIIKTGKTSITIDVQVYSTHQPQLAEAHTVKVTEAILTYVALHQDGSKRELPEH
ncbi:acyl-CoA thioesterase [Paludibacterium denitrificans]|nr:acyl-CoA thioesterase [Paludibacterium denitrificans]HJV07708.1 acyl-CoA thioesterase [Chromobacteriaceae bacterium]